MQPEPQILTDAPNPERSGKRQIADLRIEEIPDKDTRGQADAPVAPCPWCGAPVVRRKFGKHVKTFCDPDCKNAFNNGLAWLGKFLGRCANEPGLLRATIENLANADSPSLTTPERATPPSKVSGHPKNEDGR